MRRPLIRVWALRVTLILIVPLIWASGLLIIRVLSVLILSLRVPLIVSMPSIALVRISAILKVRTLIRVSAIIVGVLVLVPGLITGALCL